jgi:carbonic anhydrase
MIPPLEALERLQEGNRRYVSDHRGLGVSADHFRRGELAVDQEPFAVILGCSDSRVTPEFIFDMGPGDLFVIRVAGNIATRSQIGSIEFAVDRLGTQLIVVLGHSMCGAILATLEEIEHPSEGPSPNLHSIIDHVRPAVDKLLARANHENPDLLVQQAIRANIRASAAILRHGSKVIEQRTKVSGSS